MTSKVPKGLATWAGVIAAAGQYAGAVAVFLAADDQALAIAPLVTASGVLWKVIEGRMAQAQTLAEVDAALTPRALRPDYDKLQQKAGTLGNALANFGASTNVTSTWKSPRPGAELRTEEPEPFDRRHEERDLHDGRET